MVRHKHRGRGYRKRDVTRKKKREKGVPNVNIMLQKFSPGDQIHVTLSSSVASASPHRRFVGKTGKVIRKQGRFCYIVGIKDMRAKKEIILHAAHMKKVKVKVEKKE